MVKQLAKQPVNMDVALATLSALDIKLEIGISSSSLANSFQHGCSQGRASQIGVQNHSGGVDDRAQRKSQREVNLLLHRVGDPGESKLNPGCIQPGSSDFGAQAVEHGTGRVSHRRLAFGGHEGCQPGAAQQLIDRGKFAVKLGLVSDGHWE